MTSSRFEYFIYGCNDVGVRGLPVQVWGRVGTSVHSEEEMSLLWECPCLSLHIILSCWVMVSHDKYIVRDSAANTAVGERHLQSNYTAPPTAERCDSFYVKCNLSWQWICLHYQTYLYVYIAKKKLQYDNILFRNKCGCGIQVKFYVVFVI